ncbi:MAG TPA: hypothetical protein VGP93_11925, partial [Polyangiaceae bacterium]|nr:hypothetical protein [Polyangiaceae bacterium]
MTGFHLALSTLLAALFFAAALSVARVLGEKLATERFSPLRFGLWLGLLCGGAFALSRAQQPLLFAALSWLVACVLFLGTTIELRGSPVRRRGAVAELYVLGLGLVFLLMRSKGMLTGAAASPQYAFALQVETSELALPALSLLGQFAHHGFEAGSAVVYAASHELGTHLFAVTALSAFAC